MFRKGSPEGPFFLLLSLHPPKQERRGAADALSTTVRVRMTTCFTGTLVEPLSPLFHRVRHFAVNCVSVVDASTSIDPVSWSGGPATALLLLPAMPCLIALMLAFFSVSLLSDLRRNRLAFPPEQGAGLPSKWVGMVSWRSPIALMWVAAPPF